MRSPWPSAADDLAVDLAAERQVRVRTGTTVGLATHLACRRLVRIDAASGELGLERGAPLLGLGLEDRSRLLLTSSYFTLSLCWTITTQLFLRLSCYRNTTIE